MNVDGLGKETVTPCGSGADPRRGGPVSVDGREFVALERMAQKSVDNLLHGLGRASRCRLSRCSLGWAFVMWGKRWQNLAKSLKTWMRSNPSLSNLMALEEIGPIVAESVASHFQDATFLEMVQRLQEAGLQMEVVLEEPLGTALEGEVVVVSGVFETMSRDEAKAAVTSHGGRLVGSISSKTTLVLAGDKMGPSKLQKAEKLGIPLMDEAAFLARIGGQ